MRRFKLITIFLALFASLFIQVARADARGEVAIITGSSSGLGYELSKLAMAKNMRLLLVDIKPEASEALAAEYRERGGEALVVAADLAEPAQRATIFDTAVENFGTVNYLFNNAGYTYITSLTDHDMAMAKRNFEVNYWAYIDLAQRAANVMAKDGGGHIINISSIFGFTPASQGLAVYAANKHALNGFFRTIAPELKAQNIDVKLVFPAGMRTKIFQSAVGKKLDKSVDMAANWEPPIVVAKEIFENLHDGELYQYPSRAGWARKQYIKAVSAENAK